MRPEDIIDRIIEKEPDEPVFWTVPVPIKTPNKKVWNKITPEAEANIQKHMEARPLKPLYINEIYRLIEQFGYRQAIYYKYWRLEKERRLKL